MDLNNAFSIIEKSLAPINKENNFKKVKTDEESLMFKSDKGIYKISFESDILLFECSYEDKGADTEFDTISKTLFELDRVEDNDAKYAGNEIADEITSLFGAKKKVDLDKVKMPKSVSRSKAKKAMINFDIDSLANRFGVIFPETKDIIKQNIVDNGEFLPEDFFENHGAPVVLDVIKNGSETDKKKVFRMLNEVYEDGTNDVQDIIGVTILGAMKNNKDLMDIADKYMVESLAGPVHEINKITAKNNRFTKQLKNPPAYKPKKKSKMLQNPLTDPNNR